MTQSWLQRMRCRVLRGVVILLAIVVTVASTSRAQAYEPGLLMVVIPDSVLPLAFQDTAGPPLTSYACLNTLNTTHGYLNLYKAYVHQDFRLDGSFVIVFPDSVDIESLAADYSNSGCVTSAAPVLSVVYDATPNDTLFQNAGGTPGERQWALDANHTRIDQAWDITTGDSNIVIAVVDAGVFWEHPDLIDNMWVNAGEDINHNGTFECWSSSLDSNGVYGDVDSLDNDGNGRVPRSSAAGTYEGNSGFAWESAW